MYFMTISDCPPARITVYYSLIPRSVTEVCLSSVLSTEVVSIIIFSRQASLNPSDYYGGGFHPCVFCKFPTDFFEFFQPSLVAVRGSFVHILMYSGLKFLNRLPDYV
jgi:hypothetical protein